MDNRWKYRQTCNCLLFAFPPIPRTFRGTTCVDESLLLVSV
ncbi:hypothetical protein UC8_09990 [Roseimaritima ulvae]|uniref:Uncharacterized protein n=1 Tax=Roseimaritima ulvae TaxID=980254 RepID=A0A5B9QJ26_9BACT|nr:hypothetical protein UC8_09990 [Roseimaritima ulvae]